MQGDQKVIEYLNKALRHELTAVNQYWLHYRILDNWGFKDLAKTWRKELIEEMEHADLLIARVLFLEGHPNMQPSDGLRIGQDLKNLLECDLAAEVDARTLYLEAAQALRLGERSRLQERLREADRRTRSTTSTSSRPSSSSSARSASSSTRRNILEGWKTRRDQALCDLAAMRRHAYARHH